MTTVGILGTGRMAVRIADQLALNGHSVLLGSRTPARARAIAAQMDGRITGTTYAEAMQAPFVLPAVFVREGAFDLVREHADRLAGKTILDILNPFDDTYTDFLLPWNTSAGEQLAALLPSSTVVGIFKNIFWETFENPDFARGRSDIYVVGDDDDAKQQVIALFGRSPFRFVDGGPLRNARVVERMTLFARELGARGGYLPRVGWAFLGEPWKGGEHDRYAHLIAR
jgi:predicted dinucleotide-binding enzyme